MSQIGDAICSAIDDGARNHAAIVEATGFESKQVSNHLFHLKASGAVVKGPDGLVRGDGTAPKRTVHEAAQSEGSPPPATRKKASKVKRRAAKRRAKAAVSTRVAKSARIHKREPAPVPVVATNRIASQRFGDFVVLRHHDLVELVETLERWRSVVRND